MELSDCMLIDRLPTVIALSYVRTMAFDFAAMAAIQTVIERLS